jgi:hypothetical protein
LWDTYFISQGLERHGYYGLAWDLNARICAVVDRSRKYPEFTRGGEESEPELNAHIIDVWNGTYRRRNRIEQPPQEIQAWTVAAMASIETKRSRSDKLRAEGARERRLEEEIQALIGSS